MAKIPVIRSPFSITLGYRAEEIFEMLRGEGVPIPDNQKHLLSHTKLPKRMTRTQILYKGGSIGGTPVFDSRSKEELKLMIKTYLERGKATELRFDPPSLCLADSKKTLGRLETTLQELGHKVVELERGSVV